MELAGQKEKSMIIDKNNRIQFADSFLSDYLPANQAPKFNSVIEEEHNYYLRCPLCGKISEHKSKVILETLTCSHCKTEMTKEGALLFDALKNIRYLPF